jgi:hypothetical protein
MWFSRWGLWGRVAGGAGYVRRLGWGFDGWQDGAGRLILAKRGDGMYAADQILVSIPRQVGKTYLFGAIVSRCVCFVRG